MQQLTQKLIEERLRFKKLVFGISMFIWKHCECMNFFFCLADFRQGFLFLHAIKKFSISLCLLSERLDVVQQHFSFFFVSFFRMLPFFLKILKSSRVARETRFQDNSDRFVSCSLWLEEFVRFFGFQGLRMVIGREAFSLEFQSFFFFRSSSEIYLETGHGVVQSSMATSFRKWWWFLLRVHRPDRTFQWFFSLSCWIIARIVDSKGNIH